MRIREVPDGSEIICCGATAEILSKGESGCRFKVLPILENSGFYLGNQIWSNESIVELAAGEQGIGKSGVSTAKAIKVPITLF